MAHLAHMSQTRKCMGLLAAPPSHARQHTGVYPHSVGIDNALLIMKKHLLHSVIALHAQHHLQCRCLRRLSSVGVVDPRYLHEDIWPMDRHFADQ